MVLSYFVWEEYLQFNQENLFSMLIGQLKYIPNVVHLFSSELRMESQSKVHFILLLRPFRQFADTFYSSSPPTELSCGPKLGIGNFIIKLLYLPHPMAFNSINRRITSNLHSAKTHSPRFLHQPTKKKGVDH